MVVEIVMPRLSDTMEEGTILRWLKQAGDRVTAGEMIAEVETDKADMELEAMVTGTLVSIEVGVGQTVVVGTVLALVDGDGAGAGAGAGAAVGTATSDGEPGDGAPPAAAAAAAAAPPPPVIKSSPAARQLAEEHGIALAEIHGSGPGGRIVKGDVVAFVAPDRSASEGGSGGGTGAGSSAGSREHAPRYRATSASPAGALAPAPRETGSGTAVARPAPREARSGTAPARPAERHELSRMRRSIARRMSASFREVPHFSVTAEIDMTEAVRLKNELVASEVYPTPPTYTHMILRASALALRRHPRLNSSFQDDALVVHADVNLGMAVAVEDGLIVPILRNADERSLAELAVEAHRLAEQATQGRFTREDLTGGTFTVSNLGMFDIEHFTAVINPPQAAILAVGGIKERAVVREGRLEAARTMHVTLSCDHRIVDGVVASRFLEELKRLLEHPIVLVVDGR